MARLDKSMDWFTQDIDNELRSPNPPPGEMIVTLYLMMDKDFMMAMLKRRCRGRPSKVSIAGISRNSRHPLYSHVKQAFYWAQKRLKLAGFRPDPWPMRFVLPVSPPVSPTSLNTPPTVRGGGRFSHLRRLKDRRLTWEPTLGEIKEAWRMYRRFIREGFRPFSVDSQGDPLIPVDSFDPQAGEIMFRVQERG